MLITQAYIVVRIDYETEMKSWWKMTKFLCIAPIPKNDCKLHLPCTMTIHRFNSKQQQVTHPLQFLNPWPLIEDRPPQPYLITPGKEPVPFHQGPTAVTRSKANFFKGLTVNARWWQTGSWLQLQPVSVKTGHTILFSLGHMQDEWTWRWNHWWWFLEWHKLSGKNERMGQRRNLLTLTKPVELRHAVRDK